MKQYHKVLLDLHLPDTLPEPVEQTVLQVKDLEKSLLVLRLAFGKLKAAAADAFLPLQAVLVPAVTKAVHAATGLVNRFSQVLAGVLGVQAAQTKVERSVVRTAAAARGWLASFDQLQRLPAQGGGSTQYSQTVPVEVKTTLSPGVQETVNQINAILEPLKQIDLLPLQWTLTRTGEAAAALGSTLGTMVGQIWHGALAPFVAWVSEQLLPVFLNMTSGGLQLLQVALEKAGEGFGVLWQAAAPVVEFLGSVVLTVLDQLRRFFAQLRMAIDTDGLAINQVLSAMGQALQALWALVGPVLEQLRIAFAQSFEKIGGVVITAAGYMLDALTGVMIFLTGLFSGDWDTFWGGLSYACKGAVNSVIALLNGLLAGLTAGVNGIFKLLNNISITVPDWVPELGGQKFGFSLKTLAAPQIPYLAAGAVLPANHPFLAVVGDQKHGTNVEAPLATIQQAVAQVMGDQLSALQAGFDATVQELRLLRSTVNAIELGDTVIGQAAQRYADARAYMYGSRY